MLFRSCCVLLRRQHINVTNNAHFPEAHCLLQLDSDGPVLFDHLTRQPLGLGHSPDPRILERLEASDKLLWMDEFKRLMRLCKERRCQMQETIYIIRYEEYRFTQPHSQRVMVRLIIFCSNSLASVKVQALSTYFPAVQISQQLYSSYERIGMLR